MVPYVKVNFQVIVFGYSERIDNSELSLPSNSMCHRKVLTYRFCPVHKSNNSELTEGDYRDRGSSDVGLEASRRRF